MHERSRAVCHGIKIISCNLVLSIGIMGRVLGVGELGETLTIRVLWSWFCCFVVIAGLIIVTCAGKFVRADL